MVAGDGIQLTSTDNYVTIRSIPTPHYGLVHVQGNSTETTISAAGTAVLANATFTVSDTLDFDGTTAGRLTYTGTPTVVLTVKATVSLNTAAGSNKDLAIYIAKNGTVISGTKMIREVDHNQQGNTGTFWNVSFSTNDYVELFVSNETDTNNIIVESAIIGVI